MNKPLLFILLTGLLLSFSFTYCQKTNLEMNGISGKVSSIRETIYSASNNAGDNGKETIVSDYLTTYNTDGNKQKISEFKNNALFSYIIYNYFEQGIITGCNEYNANNSLYLSISYSSDDNGFVKEAKYNRILQKTFDNDRVAIDVEYEKYYKNLFTKILYQNDYKGYVINEEYYTPDNRLSFKLRYSYDYKYNKVGIKYYNKNGSVSWRKKLKYDSKGNRKESKLFESNRLALVSKFEYEFDQNKNWIKRIETRQLYTNFFASEHNDNTYTTIRKIEYY